MTAAQWRMKHSVFGRESARDSAQNIGAAVSATDSI